MRANIWPALFSLLLLLFGAKAPVLAQPREYEIRYAAGAAILYLEFEAHAGETSVIWQADLQWPNFTQLPHWTLQGTVVL